jgi:hypothetical protein
MWLAGTTDASVYEWLRDVLRRQPAITTVTYRPDRIVNRFLQVRVDPEPESPTIDVEWRILRVSYHSMPVAAPSFQATACITSGSWSNMHSTI